MTTFVRDWTGESSDTAARGLGDAEGATTPESLRLPYRSAQHEPLETISAWATTTAMTEGAQSLR